ncbi:MAG: Mur ligase family protein [Planctomycetota bacterium]
MPSDQAGRTPAAAPCYMIGLGGVGLSGLARLAHARGTPVSGTDTTASDITRSLATLGIDVHIGSPPARLPDGTGAVIASAAIKPEHPLLLDAQSRGIPVQTYAEALGASMRAMTGVAIAGTHGKSTTSAMLSACLIEAGLDPTVIVGAACPHLTDELGNATGFRLGSTTTPAGTHAGQPGLLIAEACEYNRSFHNLRPRVASIANVEADHLDIYGSVDAVIDAFREFASLLPPATARDAEGGVLLIGHDTAHRRDVTRGLACRVETIGFNPAADWHVSLDPGTRRVTIEHRGRQAAEFTSPMPGEHSAINAATAFALADLLGADPEPSVRALAGFRGVRRRLERLDDRPVPGGTVRVYDDYGHHPTEVEMTLRAIRTHEQLGPVDENSAGPDTHLAPDVMPDPSRRLICVFQPHQHSRTRFFLDEFASAFEQADIVIVPHIYFVRDSEAEKQRVAASDLVDRLRTRGVRAMHVYPFEAIVEQVESIARPGDVLLVMGAGPVWQVAHGFVGRAAAEHMPLGVSV